VTARELFRLSPLKQRKVAMVTEFLGPRGPGEYLDLGSDNGVVSLILREGGGRWSSADLSSETVQAIRDLVVERVEHFDGQTFPFATEQFSGIAVVDMLEHLEDEGPIVRELSRMLKPGGVLVVNVPNPIPGMLRSLRLAVGQSDERHGHRRAGYSIEQLTALLSPNFQLERSQSYGRWFSEVVDFAITAAVDLLKGGHRGVKGQVVTMGDLSKRAGSLKLYKVIAPLLNAMVKLDAFLPGDRGNMLIARFRKRE
jgi:SAM-dependent methyltransferase